MNQIVLGFDYMWATTGFVANEPGFGNARAQAFYGRVHSVMLFNRAAETNTVVSSNMLGSGLANCGYAASRWLEKSDTDIAVDGTSMMRPNYKYNSIETNEILMAYSQRHPEIPCVSDYSCAGQSLTTMQPANQSAKLNSPIYGMPYLHITQLPTGKVKRRILITDHPRNDVSSVSDPYGLFNSWYAFLRPYLTDLIQISDGNETVPGNGATFYKNLTNCIQMKNSQLITRWVPEFQYVQPKGIIDCTDTNLTTGNHNDGANQAYAWNQCQQWAGLIDGVPMQPWGVNTASGVTNTVQQFQGAWPIYTVTLSGSPCFWTNLTGTDCLVKFAGGAVTGVSINGVQDNTFPTIGTTMAGATTLSMFDVIGFTNSGVPTLQYKPLAPK
jgi:hypothetical protein